MSFENSSDRGRGTVEGVEKYDGAWGAEYVSAEWRAVVGQSTSIGRKKTPRKNKALEGLIIFVSIYLFIFSPQTYEHDSHKFIRIHTQFTCDITENYENILDFQKDNFPSTFSRIGRKDLALTFWICKGKPIYLEFATAFLKLISSQKSAFSFGLIYFG